MTFEALAARLERVQEAGDGQYSASCPGHEDRHNSLSLKEINGRILLHCFAGCSTEKIVASLGLGMADLQDKPPVKMSKKRDYGTLEASYPYHDAEGHLLYEVQRYRAPDGGKQFPVRRPVQRPDGTLQWIWGQGHVKRVLYHLPQLLAAVRDQRIYIVEGEKDVHTLESAGRVATTSPGGAGKWQAEYNEVLRGAEVCILPDNDEPGERHAREIEKSLLPVAKSVRVLLLRDVWPMPPKGDITDMVQAIGEKAWERLAALESLPDRLPERFLTVAPRLSDDLPERLDKPDDFSKNANDPSFWYSGTAYEVEDGRLIEPYREGTRVMADFVPMLVREVSRDDGEGHSIWFHIEGVARGRTLPRIVVASHEFVQMNWPTVHWGILGNISPFSGAKEHLRHAIFEAASQHAQRGVEYTHTGWRKLNGQWLFLHGNGAIGASDPKTADDIRVGLEGKLSAYALPDGTQSEQDSELTSSLSSSLSSSLALLDAAPRGITLPLLAFVYMSPLSHFLREGGVPPSFLLALLGTTGKGKSSIAGLFMSHFGKSFTNGRENPASFTDTVNTLRYKAFLCKDVPLLVDDQYPPSSKRERELAHASVQSLARSYGDGAERGRMTGDLRLVADKPARGTAILTMEDVPDVSESGMARMLVVRVEERLVEGLTQAQENGYQGVYAEAMAGYIAWLAAMAEDLPQTLRALFLDFRARAAKALTGSHARLPEAVAHLTLGFHMLLTYSETLGVITDIEKTRQGAFEAFVALASEQSDVLQEEKPSNLFLEALKTLVAGDRASLCAVSNTLGIYDVGYEDARHVYLVMGLAYQAVYEYYQKSGRVFPVSQRMLVRQMAAEGLLVCNQKGKNMYKLWQTSTGKAIDVVCLPKSVWMAEEENSK